MHIDLQRKVESLEDEVKSLQTQLQTQHEEAMGTLPTLVADKVLSSVTVHGAQQMSVDQMRSVVQEMFTTYGGANNPGSAASDGAQVTEQPVTEEGYAFFTWGGRIRPVPEDWSFPRGNVKTMCDLFVIGVPALKIRPFRRVHGQTLRRSDQQYFYKAEFVFQHILSTAVERELVTALAMRTVTLAQWDDIFAASFAHELSMFPVPLKKAGDISVITYYDKLKANGNVIIA